MKLIITDQLRGDALHCMGNEAVISPHIDQLAQEGTLFTSGYTSAPSSTPARAGLLTGMSPWHHGMLGYGRVARKYPYEMPQMLCDLGYYTFGIGKMHWFPQKSLHGFHATLVDESGCVESPDFISDYRAWFQLHAPGQDPDKTGVGWNDHGAKVYQLDEKLHPTTWTGQTGTRVDQPVELREFLPTFLQVAGGEVPADMDGQSLLHLVTGKQQEWRKYIDMEHATCYSADNYWCALTDGKIKYIWFMHTGEEQLFDLVKDLGEERNVAQAKPYQKQLAEMRQAMVHHLSERGDGFVKDGYLVKREQILLYSLHYPKSGS